MALGSELLNHRILLKSPSLLSENTKRKPLTQNIIIVSVVHIIIEYFSFNFMKANPILRMSNLNSYSQKDIRIVKQSTLHLIGSGLSCVIWS